MSSRWRCQLLTDQNVTRNVVTKRGKFLSSVLIFPKYCVLSLGHAMCTFRFWLADVKEIDGYLQTESQSSLVLCPRSQANSYAKLSRRGLIQDLVKSAATLPRILSLPRMQVEFILLVIELCAGKMQLPWERSLHLSLDRFASWKSWPYRVLCRNDCPFLCFLKPFHIQHFIKVWYTTAFIDDESG